MLLRDYSNENASLFLGFKNPRFGSTENALTFEASMKGLNNIINQNEIPYYLYNIHIRVCQVEQ